MASVYFKSAKTICGITECNKELRSEPTIGLIWAKNMASIKPNKAYKFMRWKLVT